MHMELQITKYGSRNWAVWVGGELLAVTVYKKGAKAIVALLEQCSLPKITLTTPKSLTSPGV